MQATAYWKDYAGWHARKQQLNRRPFIRRYFYEREVWWTAIGVNIGFEQDGKHRTYARPVVILRKFNPRLFLGVPLSTTGKRGRYYFHFRYTAERDSVAVLSQLRAYDSHRLVNKSGMMRRQDFTNLRTAIIRMIAQERLEK